MQRERVAALRWTIRVVDALILLISFIVVAGLREQIGSIWVFDLVPGTTPVLQKVTLQNQLHLIVQVLPIWMLALHLTGAYEDLRRLRSDVLFLRLARAVGLAVGGLLALQFVVQPAIPTSRTFLLGFAVVSVALLYGARLGWLRWVAPRAERPYNILVVGSANEAIPLMRILERHRDWGMRIVGVVRPDADTLSPLDGEHVLGNVSDLPRILARENIAQVFLTGRAWEVQTLRFVADTCEEVGVTFSMDANFLGLSVSEADLSDYEGWSILSFSSTPPDAEALVVKRIIDLAGSTAALLILAPVFFVLSVLIRLEDGGPIFFVQERSGLYGRKFPMVKFRSMVVDAEAKKAALAAQNEMSGPVFKMKSDPRITRIGRFIRKTSLDEIPQFWNVLRGEMSLVGPRPPIPSEVARYERWQMRRLSMKPGITCIWQVSGRNEIDFESWMRLDLEYIDNWSLFLDLKLLLRTVPVVFGGSSAGR